jgi:hypothetical protein
VLFFAAHTLQVKVSRDFASLALVSGQQGSDDDDSQLHQEFKHRLLHLLAHYASKSIVMRQLCLAVSESSFNFMFAIFS